MNSRRIIVVGGGAAGFFAAITCAEAAPDAGVMVLEKGAEFLSKVRVSGGGRCNVTHASLDPREFAAHYPRGGRALLAPFQRFSARDTVAWFESRGVKLKTESDGRMFPVSDSSQTVMDCLLRAAKSAGVKLRLNSGVEQVARLSEGGFEVELERRALSRHVGVHALACRPNKLKLELQRNHCAGLETGAPPVVGGETLACDRLLLAVGGCRAPATGQLAVALGHTLEPPVPSLFTFQIESPWLRSLAGLSVEQAELSVPLTKWHERGPLLVTHRGLTGPAVLQLSAWGARALHDLNYQFPLWVNWLPGGDAGKVFCELNAHRQTFPARFVAKTRLAPLPSRLWEQLVLAAGIPRDTRWASLTRAKTHALTQQLVRTKFLVAGKIMNKDEFVTCGGVRLGEVNFKTMESRICPGLHFAGELLDIDGLTGGFNFQAAWTTGWLAGRAMAGG